jgi:hypothetical protein
MKPDWEAYAVGVEKQLVQLRKDLAPLEAGELKMGERKDGGQWEDITQEAIDRNKAAIATYETILADVRANRIGK